MPGIARLGVTAFAVRVARVADDMEGRIKIGIIPGGRSGGRIAVRASELL